MYNLAFTKCSRVRFLYAEIMVQTELACSVLSLINSYTLFFFSHFKCQHSVSINGGDCLLCLPNEDKQWATMWATKNHYHLWNKSPMPIWFVVYLFSLCAWDVFDAQMFGRATIFCQWEMKPLMYIFLLYVCIHILFRTTNTRPNKL